MIVSSLYESCQQLFTGYPLAVRVGNGSDAGGSMILMVHEGPGSFVLRLDDEEGWPVYSIAPWPAGDAEEVAADSHPPVSEGLANALLHGIPVPRDGSLFGWIHDDAVCALVTVYADESESPVPSWSVMPLVGTAEWQWPPFTDERLFGGWFWKHYAAGEVICLGDLVAQTPATVFWVDTKAALSSDCCAVERDIRTATGHTFRRGSYVYFQAIRDGKQLPSLDALLADPAKVDLAPWFDTSSCAGT
jgi:hypothetical protein